MRPDCHGGKPPSARGLAKPADSVQPSAYPVPTREGKSRRKIRRLPGRRRASGRVRWSPSASRELCLQPVAAHHSAVTSAMPEHRTMMTAPVARLAVAETGEHDKTTLLALVEALVERTGGIGELPERGGALTHHLSPQIEPLDRVFRLVGVCPRGKALGALLGEITQRGFHRRPVLFLLGRQLEPGMKPRNARITKGRDVFSAWTPALHTLEVIRPLLRIDQRRTGNRKRGRAGENCFPHGHLQWRFLPPSRRALYCPIKLRFS